MPTDTSRPITLIVGAGPGLSASLARRLAATGRDLVLTARDTADLAPLAEETGATLVECDARDPEAAAALFERIDAMDGPLDACVYNPSPRARGAIADVTPEQVETALMVTAFGAYRMAHHAASRMLAAGGGTMLFTGASAGVKGYPRSAPFAMGKFALRGLCQSLARELHPQGVHVGHAVIDGAIGRTEGQDRLDPDAIADTYMPLIGQPRSAWAWEVELRPWVETF